MEELQGNATTPFFAFTFKLKGLGIEAEVRAPGLLLGMKGLNVRTTHYKSRFDRLELKRLSDRTLSNSSCVELNHSKTDMK